MSSMSWIWRQQTQSSANRRFSESMSLIYKKNNNWLKAVPCGTQDKTGAHSDFVPLTTTLCCQEHQNESIQRTVLPFMPYPNSLLLISSWGGVSNTFSNSNIMFQPVHLYPSFYHNHWLPLPTEFHNCVFSWMLVAYLTRGCVFRDDPWCLNILCAQVTCREYMLKR